MLQYHLVWSVSDDDKTNVRWCYHNIYLHILQCVIKNVSKSQQYQGTALKYVITTTNKRMEDDFQ